jgi:methyl-accepting chemotaxis protein
MRKNLSYGQKIGIGFLTLALIAVSMGGLSVYALRKVVVAKDNVIAVYARNLVDASNLESEALRRIANNRAYLLTGDSQCIEDLQTSRKTYAKWANALRGRLVTTEEEQVLAQIEKAAQAQSDAADRLMPLRTEKRELQELTDRFQKEVVPKNREVTAGITHFLNLEEYQLDQARRRSTEAANAMANLVMAIGVGGVIVAIVLAVVLNSVLKRQIGSAVQHIQTSSNELQAAATQQTTGSKEQSASTNEIATTIKELVATARQIAESAQHVATIAQETAQGARIGDQTLQHAQEAVVDIKRQVDLIVSHMLDLGTKSRQIGGILEIINEMAEQTNILSINASIEAVGAGEAGKRFAIVADEIRKLADRVGGSTKEIKSIIEEIRSAVHTTVMATESGSKAVDAGAREFGEVSAAFQRIASLVETTTAASREIELSTKQQTTAVEQVNVAIANVAQAAKESEVSCTQTLQTVSELTLLSKDLSRLVQTQLSA